jgi:GT2 family glycosyltransferase
VTGRVPTRPPDEGVVRLVVLNHDGGAHVLRCLEHLHALDWPPDRLEIVVVDNASTDGSADAAAERFPDVVLIRREANDGFPANNDALRDLDGVRYVGLVNSDAFVEPGFLRPLVDALDEDRGLGAASPLMLFASPFVDLAIATTAAPPGRGDARALGVLVRGLWVAGEDRWAEAPLVEGSFGPELLGEGRVEWTTDRAVLRVPVPEGSVGPVDAELHLSAVTPKEVVLASPAGEWRVELGPAPRWVPVVVDGDRYDVVNNAGNVVYDDGYGADRGYGSADVDAFARPAEVFAWSGGAVLLRPAYLADVGLFDERYFLYYEDTDLAWRGRSRGWRYRVEPAARVRHLHAATAGEGSARQRYFVERNRLVTVLKNGPGPMVRRELRRSVADVVAAVRRDVVRPALHARRPNVTPASRRARALAGVVRLAPGALVDRRRIRRRARVPADRVAADLTPRTPVDAP